MGNNVGPSMDRHRFKSLFCRGTHAEVGEIGWMTLSCRDKWHTLFNLPFPVGTVGVIPGAAAAIL